MSFSFNASGSPKEAIAIVGKEVAESGAIPNEFGDAINDQLGRLPADAEVTLVCYGHTGWTEGQQSGEMSLHATINARIAQPKTVARIEDRDPEAQPGPERFPDGFEGDPPPGPAADEPAE